MKSLSVTIKPMDSRCRYWAKIVRAGIELPLSSACNGANDVPGPYLRNGEEELFEGDFLFEGEEAHHRKNRGWEYRITYMDPTKTEEDARAAFDAMDADFLRRDGFKVDAAIYLEEITAENEDIFKRATIDSKNVKVNA